MTDLPCNCTPCLLGEWSHAEERLPTLAQWQALNARLEKAESVSIDGLREVMTRAWNEGWNAASLALAAGEIPRNPYLAAPTDDASVATPAKEWGPCPACGSRERECEHGIDAPPVQPPGVFVSGFSATAKQYRNVRTTNGGGTS